MAAVTAINRAIDTQPLPRPELSQPELKQRLRNTPPISTARRRASINDHSLSLDEVRKCAETPDAKQKTFLYLAYGSNLCAETFQGKRKIKPISQINVVVPEITLTFDLCGIPYSEPCFANCKYRQMNEKGGPELCPDDYHKDRWKKGLVGVVYEVTAADYAHIIATEGGGSGYKDVTVDCYVLDSDPNVPVPISPETEAFRAHTLLASARSRPDPSYAQPSARYKKLITNGAREHDLPYEYQDYLDSIRAYEITTTKQKIGKTLFVALWGPVFAFLFLGGLRVFLRKNGTYPEWVGQLLTALFKACWTSYDAFYYPAFGDGERTIGQGKDDKDETTGILQASQRDEQVSLLESSWDREKGILR